MLRSELAAGVARIDTHDNVVETIDNDSNSTAASSWCSLNANNSNFKSCNDKSSSTRSGSDSGRNITLACEQPSGINRAPSTEECGAAQEPIIAEGRLSLDLSSLRVPPLEATGAGEDRHSGTRPVTLAERLLQGWPMRRRSEVMAGRPAAGAVIAASSSSSFLRPPEPLVRWVAQRTYAPAVAASWRLPSENREVNGVMLEADTVPLLHRRAVKTLSPPMPLTHSRREIECDVARDAAPTEREAPSKKNQRNSSNNIDIDKSNKNDATAIIPATRYCAPDNSLNAISTFHLRDCVKSSVAPLPQPRRVGAMEETEGKHAPVPQHVSLLRYKGVNGAPLCSEGGHRRLDAAGVTSNAEASVTALLHRHQHRCAVMALEGSEIPPR
ncbi:hypothetical protein DQ04_02051050 [Trypanosoma grayi]|uniref:hypothetical protein n=1 Tax=Trypanosoma grayi TaxID=71804 RepID=UPI0004F3EF99|nr:hypothetical protein DQ04_02051050 [Trypanosoma grayi]KEG12040.1 hypothetical protein DQ04_02051050 [Trypanosoma grayi]